jgi:hypothetical protein
LLPVVLAVKVTDGAKRAGREAKYVQNLQCPRIRSAGQAGDGGCGSQLQGRGLPGVRRQLKNGPARASFMLGFRTSRKIEQAALAAGFDRVAARSTFSDSARSTGWLELSATATTVPPATVAAVRFRKGSSLQEARAAPEPDPRSRTSVLRANPHVTQPRQLRRIKARDHGKAHAGRDHGYRARSHDEWRRMLFLDFVQRVKRSSGPPGEKTVRAEEIGLEW